MIKVKSFCTRSKAVLILTGLVFLSALILVGCGSGNSKDKDGQPVSLTLYSGRSEDLIGPVLEKFSQETGIKINARYGDTAELAATLLEEGKNSPADVFLAQDAGALGAVAVEKLFLELPVDILNKVEGRFQSPPGDWVGVSGRARVVAYNTGKLTKDELPESIVGFTDPKWKGRIGWPPTNGSFQAFVTGMRVTLGEKATREWLIGIKANEPRVYPKNTPAVEAVARGEVDVAFVNHYYLHQLKAEHGEDFPVENYYPKGGDPGVMINVAGIGIMATSKQKDAAKELISCLLSEKTQAYFAEKTFEYPLAKGVAASPGLVPLSEVQTPDIDLSDLSDLENTLKLLRDTGVLD